MKQGSVPRLSEDADVVALLSCSSSVLCGGSALGGRGREKEKRQGETEGEWVRV